MFLIYFTNINISEGISLGKFIDLRPSKHFPQLYRPKLYEHYNLEVPTFLRNYLKKLAHSK
jgi:hypothetical protein